MIFVEFASVALMITLDASEVLKVRSGDSPVTRYGRIAKMASTEAALIERRQFQRRIAYQDGSTSPVGVFDV